MAKKLKEWYSLKDWVLTIDRSNPNTAQTWGKEIYDIASKGYSVAYKWLPWQAGSTPWSTASDVWANQIWKKLAPNSPIVTSSSVRNEFDKNVENLNKETTQPESTNTPWGTNTGWSKTTTTTSNTPTGEEDEYTKSLRLINEKKQAELDALDAEKTRREEEYQKLKSTADEQQKQLLDQINAQYNTIENEMRDTNSRFNAITNQNQYSINGFRYTPQQSAGMVYDTEQYGIKKLQEIQNQRASVLLQAARAKTEKDYEALNEHMTALNQLSKDRLSVLNEMATTAKDIKDSIETVKDLNWTEVGMMNSMLSSYWIDLENIKPEDKEEWYKEKAKELSEALWVKISPAFVKAQMTVYSKDAQQKKKLPSAEMSKMFWFYVNADGDAILTTDGQKINYTEGDSVSVNEKTGQMFITGRDEYGNKTIKTVNIPGYISESTGTQTGITATFNISGGTDLSSLYTGNNWPAFANNNPWNIKDTSFGGTANWKWWFTKFNTVEEWINALLQKLEYNKANGVNGVDNGSAYNGNMTLLQYISKYAPSADGNNPAAYALRVAQMTGTTIGTKIKDIDTEKLAMAIMQHENGALYRVLQEKGIISEWGINLANQYSPDTDKQLTAVGSTPNGWKLYLDARTNNTITGEEAKSLYWQATTGAPKSQFTPEQIAVMSTITGKPTAWDKETLAKYGLDEAKLGQYRAEKAATQSAYDNLDSSVKTRIDKYVLDYENEQIVKDYNTMSIMVDSVKANQWKRSSTNDQALIYAFAKVMDPNSVVRESEYATVQEYSQALIERMIGKMKRIFSSDGFLSEEAKQKMIDTLESKVETQKTAYDNVRNQTKKQIKWKASTLSDQEIDDLLKEYKYSAPTTQWTSTNTPTDAWDWSQA